jgi:hypothetical protein
LSRPLLPKSILFAVEKTNAAGVEVSTAGRFDSTRSLMANCRHSCYRLEMLSSFAVFEAPFESSDRFWIVQVGSAELF